MFSVSKAVVRQNVSNKSGDFDVKLPNLEGGLCN